MSMDRRTFLKGGIIAATGAVAATALGGCAPSTVGSASASASASASSAAGGPPAGIPGTATVVGEVVEGVDWLGQPPEIADSQITQTLEVDALICGLGTAGLFAAAKAVNEGLNVLAIDSGAVSMVKSAVGSINNKYQTEAGVHFDKNEILNDLERYAISGTDRRLLATWADRSAEAIEFYASYMEKAGYEVLANTATPNPDTYYKHWLIELCLPAANGFDGYQAAQEALPPTVVEDIISKGGDVRYNSSLVKLVQDDSGAVTGAIVDLEGDGLTQVNTSKGVVLCTGGYASNVEMLSALQPETLQMSSMLQTTGVVKGDGIKAALWAGAEMQDSHVSMVFDRGAIPPTSEGASMLGSTGMYFSPSSQPWLKVNLNGERFANESALYESICRASLNQPGNCYCVIFDADWQEQGPQFDTQGCSRYYPYPDAPVQAAGDEMMVKMMVDMLTEAGIIVQGNTIAELAEALEIPADALEATVARYNELCEGGVDEDFGKESYRMLPVKNAPFFGFRCAGALLCTLDGLLVSPKSEVLNKDGDPIPGLYAAGNDAGGFYSTCYPSSAIGLNAGRCITFAYIAAEELAKR